MQAARRKPCIVLHSSTVRSTLLPARPVCTRFEGLQLSHFSIPCVVCTVP